MRHINLSKKVASLLSITALCTMFLAASSKAYAQFGILVNGQDVYEATHTDSFEGFEQYLAHIYVNSGDYCQLYDIGNQVAWVKTLNSSSVSAFSLQGDRYVCSASACYDFYIKIKNNADELYIGPGSGCGGTPGGGDTPGGGTDPVVPSDYASAVPSECGDIMLQAFYWNSNTDNGYGNTKWQTLSGQVSEISSYFDMVWLPPSAQASGISQGGLGYIPLIYSKQNCKMGTPTELSGLISALHNQGVRVIADIVINHIGNSSGNCDGLKTHDFGSYGSFSPTKDWLTKNDEGGCGSTGNDDDGQHDANYPSARDWDHKNVNVQNMCKAYLQWMKGEMKYDGWRYDYAGGFHVSHINAYNTASKPYFSVIEYWLGDAGVLKQRIDEAGKNTLAFDFDAKYNVYRDGIYKKNYSKCKNAGLRGKGYSKYAVTFIDNHDTFNRQNGNEPNEKGDGSSINDQSLMMRCNAYLLSMPGVPCVFWPHWVKYKSEIKKMITARKKAGIHSESTVTEEAGSGYYRATVQGKYGSVKLMLGTAANDVAPAGYTQAIKGSDYAVYYNGNGTFDVETVGANKAAQAEKFLENGQLFIRCGEHVYDAQGRLVQ